MSKKTTTICDWCNEDAGEFSFNNGLRLLEEKPPEPTTGIAGIARLYVRAEMTLNGLPTDNIDICQDCFIDAISAWIARVRGDSECKNQTTTT